MNLLKDGIRDGFVEITKLSKKLQVDGMATSYVVYRINLEKLFYNDQNDRIATWISERLSSGKGLPTETEEYNKIIEDYICKSNPKAIKDTKQNIKIFGQLEPGVVLPDGRVIDGNRRFTCLRQLHEENPLQFNYFEAVILDKDIEKNKKQIKLLELMIQHGTETRVDYDPIDKLVGLYNDVIKEKLITLDEYRDSTNMKPSEVDKKYEEAKLMVEFLEYIGKPEEFYIARDLKLDGPLVELVGIIRKTPDERKEDVKVAVFNILAVHKSGDLTREVRRVKNIVSYEKHLDKFIEESQEIAEMVQDIVIHDNESGDLINKLSSNAELKEKVRKAVEKADIAVKQEILIDGPVVQIEDILDKLKLIDINIYNRMEKSNKERFNRGLDELEKEIMNLKGKL